MTLALFKLACVKHFGLWPSIGIFGRGGSAPTFQLWALPILPSSHDMALARHQ